MNTDSEISGLSIVCVFNDIDVRRNCLDRSIESYSGPAAIDFVPVDNTMQEFRSAGAALNWGARRAKYEIVVFVHQDVYIHSLGRVVRAASLLAEDAWGMLGANGVTHEGSSIGRLRDRVGLIGCTAPTPTGVDSVDEVLFMVRRDRVLADPVTEDPRLAWHAYAAEYGLRMRSRGLRVGAVDLAITHNSLTINLDKLDLAHRRIAHLYPKCLPVSTTCGRIGQSPPPWKRVRILRDHAWRLNWLRESAIAYRVHRHLRVPVVLADVRHDVDLLSYSSESPLHVFDLDLGGSFAQYDPAPLWLRRRNRPLVCIACPSLDDLAARVENAPESASLVVTNLGFGDLDRLRGHHRLSDSIAGVQRGSVWLIAGPVTRRLPSEWNARRRVPLFHSVPRFADSPRCD